MERVGIQNKLKEKNASEFLKVLLSSEFSLVDFLVLITAFSVFKSDDSCITL